MVTLTCSSDTMLPTSSATAAPLVLMKLLLCTAPVADGHSTLIGPQYTPPRPERPVQRPLTRWCPPAWGSFALPTSHHGMLSTDAVAPEVGDAADRAALG